MARKGKVNKQWRNARDAARSGEMPNLARSSGQMTAEALQTHLQRGCQTSRRAASTAINRERGELTRRSKELA